MKRTTVKRSVALAGRHRTVRLEQPFWVALSEIAQRWHVTRSELIWEIDANRKEGNLSSAIRLFVLEVYKDQIEPPQPKGGDFKLVG
jgi:predicted DNA-binding ribbon-helix-helix protein